MDGADPKQGLARARLRLEMLAQGGGRPIVYKTYGVTAIDGTFDLELRAPFENAATATIVLTVAKPGYKIVKVRVRPPAKKREYYTTEPITLPPEPPAPPFGVEEPEAGGDVVVPEMPKGVPWR